MIIPDLSGRKQTKGHINDAIIKEPQGCALELPYTCIYKIPDKVPPKQIVDIDLSVTSHHQDIFKYLLRLLTRKKNETMQIIRSR